MRNDYSCCLRRQAAAATLQKLAGVPDTQSMDTLFAIVNALNPKGTRLPVPGGESPEEFSGDAVPDAGGGSRAARARRASLVQEENALLRARLDDAELALRSAREAVRELTVHSREQKTQIERQRLAEALYAASTGEAGDEADAQARCSRLVRILMESFGAVGGVLWARMERQDALTVQAVEGRVAPTVRLYPVETPDALSAASLRERCEHQLLAAAPPLDGNAPGRPALIVLLRRPVENDPDGPGEVSGVVGLCGSKMGGFEEAEQERLVALAGPLIAALSGIASQRRLVRRTREVSMLYDLNRLAQTATPEQIYGVVIAQARRVFPAEGAALSLLDTEESHMELRASHGRAVELLDHIPFERGKGVSGWVASSGRQLYVPDLTREPDLNGSGRVPPRVRAFAVTPVRARGKVRGVLTLTSARADAFSTEDLRLMSLFAEEAGAAILRAEQLGTLEKLTVTDDLTRLYNVRYFRRRLEDEVRRARRYNTPLTLLMFDVDNFKRVNDLYGHANGDRVLREVAAVLRQTVRETEILARYGGEEFAVILPQTDAKRARIAAERVRRAVEAHRFTTQEGHPLAVTISAGLADYSALADSADTLFQQADAALHLAKAAGRNRITEAKGKR